MGWDRTCSRGLTRSVSMLFELGLHLGNGVPEYTCFLSRPSLLFLQFLAMLPTHLGNAFLESVCLFPRPPFLFLQFPPKFFNLLILRLHAFLQYFVVAIMSFRQFGYLIPQFHCRRYLLRSTTFVNGFLLNLRDNWPALENNSQGA